MTIPFAAPLWLKTGHQQTLYAGLGFRPAPLAAERLIPVAVSDESTVIVEWNAANAAKGCLVLVHGLEGSAHEPYMISTARKALAEGLNVARVNLRGCHQRPWTSRTSYHAGLSSDLEAVCQTLVAAGETALVVAGFSLGAHLSLKWACEQSQPPEWIKGVIAVSAPLDLAATARYLQRPQNRLYDQFFLRRMKASWRQLCRYRPDLKRPEAYRLHRLEDVDNYLTAPLFGFKSAQDYYQKNSVGPLLPQLQLPALLIMAKDDPIVPAGSFQTYLDAASTHLRCLWSSEGGHVGFFNDATLAVQDRDICWAENRLLDQALNWLAAKPIP